MNTLVYFLNGMPSIVDGPFWFTALVKITLLLAVAWLVHFFITAMNPRWRVVLWRSVTVGVVAVLLLDALRLVSLPLQISTQNVTTISSLPETESNGFSVAPHDVALSPVQNENVNLNSFTAEQPQIFESSDELKVTPGAFLAWSSLAKSHWLTALGIIWLLGIAFVIAREIIGSRRLRRLVNRSTQADSALSAQASVLATEMRVGSCTVLISDQIASPLVFHASFRVTLLLPKSIVDSSEPNEMAAILTHELSHAASRDLEWNLWIKMISTLLWPHPLLWRVRKTHVAACEFVADAESSRRMKDPALYVRTLAKVALNASAANQKRMPGLAMARASAIRLRLERVVKTVGQLPPSRRRMSVVLSVGALGFAALGAFQFVSAGPVENSQADPGEKAIVVHVLDEEKKPIKDLQLDAIIHTENVPSGVKAKPEIVGNGVYRFSIPDDVTAFSVLATSKDRVRMKALWQAPDVPDGIPDEFFFELAQGTKMSGRIVDEQRNPIEGAQVYLLVRANQYVNPHASYHDYFVTTDKDGNWSSNEMPAEVDDIWIRLEHPDFVSDDTYSETVKDAPIEALRTGAHVAEMRKGVFLKGTVADESGKPIQGATVYQGSSRLGTEYPSTTTDEAGFFQFPHCRPGQIVLTAVAKGFAPDLKEIKATADPAAVEFKLKPGNTIKVRLVDTAGKPIGKSRVHANSWRGHRSLAYTHPTQTDADGNWVWNDGPADPIGYQFFKPEYMSMWMHELSPSPEVQVVVLDRELEVSGSVTNAETGKPIEDFDIVPGVGWESSPPTWEIRHARKGSAGKYTHSFNHPRDHHLVKAEALGYLPSISRKLQSNEGAVSIDFELTPSDSTTGKVLTPDGEPAVGAKLIVAVANQMNEIVEGRVRSSNNRVGKTDAQGQFVMPQEAEPFKLLITHESGVVIVDGDEIQPGEEIQLSSWAKITGTVEINGKAIKGAKIGLLDLGGPRFPQPGFSVAGEVTANDEGEFEFNRVLPDARVMVAMAVESGSGAGYRKSYTYGEKIKTEPGETHHVVVGGEGQNVIGRIVVPEKSPEFDWGFCAIKRFIPMVMPPRDFGKWPIPKRKQWQLMQEIEAAKQGPAKTYTFAVDDDGSFSVDGLPPAQYELKVTLWAKRKPRQRTGPVTLGSGVRRFSVGMPIDTKKPLDLGSITVTLLNQPQE